MHVGKYYICVVCYRITHHCLYSVNVCTLLTAQIYVTYGRKCIYNLVLVHYYTILHLINQIGMHLYVLVEPFFDLSSLSHYCSFCWICANPAIYVTCKISIRGMCSRWRPAVKISRMLLRYFFTTICRRKVKIRN